MKLVRTLVLTCLVLVGVAAGGKLAFTAGNTVAASRVGSPAAQSITAATLQPAVCTSNGVSPVGAARNASTTPYTGTASADLILGTYTANNQTINGGGGKDCIVAGKGTAGKSVTMAPTSGSGSVCVKGPGPATYVYGGGCAVKA